MVIDMTMLRKLPMTIKLTMALLACFTVCGCAEALVGGGYGSIIEAGMDKNPCWSYQPNEYESPLRKIDKSVTVLPFQDARATRFETHLLRCMVPLMPYCTDTYEPPEMHPNRNFLKNVHDQSSSMTSRVTFSPSTDFARAIVDEFQAAKVFREVGYGASDKPSDYIISGKILNTTLNDTLYSYGVSLGSIFFWAVGLPAGSITNDLSLEVAVTDTKSGEIAFTKVYTADSWKIYWIYRQPNGCKYGEMLQDINKHFVEELDTRLHAKQAGVK